MQNSLSPRHSQTGIALLAVLWLSILLAFIAQAANTLSRAEVTSALNKRSAFEAQLAADSAIELALFRYLADEEFEWYIDGTPYGWIENGTEVRVSISDERGRVDLNTGSEDALLELFARIQVEETQAAANTEAIFDFRDAARSALDVPNTVSEIELNLAGHFAFGLADELPLVVPMTDVIARRAASFTTVYTGMVTPVKWSIRSFPDPVASTELALSETPIPLYPLRATPPLGSSILRIQSESRTADGATFAREKVVVFDLNDPLRPYRTSLNRRGEQLLFPTDD